MTEKGSRHNSLNYSDQERDEVHKDILIHLEKQKKRAFDVTTWAIIFGLLLVLNEQLLDRYHDSALVVCAIVTVWSMSMLLYLRNQEKIVRRNLGTLFQEQKETQQWYSGDPSSIEQLNEIVEIIED